MTCLEDPPPWLRPSYSFASVMVWTGKKNGTILTWPFVLFSLWNGLRQHWPLAAYTTCGSLFFIYLLTWALGDVRDSGWPDLARGFSDLIIAWLLYCAGAATEGERKRFNDLLPAKLTVDVRIVVDNRAAAIATIYFRLQLLQSVDELLEFMEIWGFAILFVTGNRSEDIRVKQAA